MRGGVEVIRPQRQSLLSVTGVVVSVAAVAFMTGCTSRPTQERFRHINGLYFVSTDLARPESWQQNGDARWVQEQVKAIGGAAPSLIVGVEREEPLDRDAYPAVWVVRSGDSGSLIVTERYLVDNLLFWTEAQERELGMVPTVENTTVPLSPEEVTRLERSLASLSPHRCTDTIRFFPEQRWTFHVRTRLRGKETCFSVFAPALSENNRQAYKSRPYAEYERLSRREADVVATVLDFADQKLLAHFSVGPRAEPLGGQADPEHFGHTIDPGSEHGHRE